MEYILKFMRFNILGVGPVRLWAEVRLNIRDCQALLHRYDHLAFLLMITPLPAVCISSWYLFTYFQSRLYLYFPGLKKKMLRCLYKGRIIQE